MAVAAMAQTLQGVTDARLSTLLQASQPPAAFLFAAGLLAAVKVSGHRRVCLLGEPNHLSRVPMR
jgi:hypothetical protein